MTSCLPPARAAAVLAAALGLGCTGLTPPGNNGELNNGIFSYSCDSDSDPACDDAEPGVLATMPGKIAVGGRFTLKYTPSPFGDDTGGSAIVEPASKSLLIQTETFASSFKGVKPGLCAVLARRGDVVTDFIHVRIEAIDHLQVDSSSPTAGEEQGVESIELSAGEVMALRAYPVDEADVLLAGALSATWSSSDVEVVAFETLESDNAVTLQAMGAGTATLRVDVEDISKEISVTVAGVEEEPL